MPRQSIEVSPLLDDEAALTALLAAGGKELVLAKVSNPDCNFTVSVLNSGRVKAWGVQGSFCAESGRWDSLGEMTRVLRDCTTPVFREIMACQVGNAPIELQRIIGSSFLRIYRGDSYKTPAPDQVEPALKLLRREAARCAIAMAHFYTAMNAIVFGTRFDCVAEIAPRFGVYLNDAADDLEARFFDGDATRRVTDALQQIDFLTGSADELVIGDQNERTVN